jgi:hypothetical protein
MYFVKAAFWIFLVILLLPSNGQEKYELYGTVERTIVDIGNFCERNPDVCEKVSNMATGVVDKLRHTAEMIEEALRDVGIGAPRQHIGEAPIQQNFLGALDGDPATTATSSLSTDTLTVEDLRTDWRGPGPI